MKIRKGRSVRLARLFGIGLLALAGSASALTEEYRYFRFTQTALRGAGGENSIQLAEFEMRFEGATVTGAAATNPGGNFPAGEAPANAVDGILSTKWLDFNKSSLVLDFGAPIQADGYRFATANDAPERDPISWTLEGSDDGASWVLVHQQTDNPTTELREIYDYEFLFSNPPRIFKFEKFDQIVTNGQIAEIDYDVEDATSLEVTPDYGSVDDLEFGTIDVTPPSNTDTTYTMTATSDNGSSVATTVIRAVEQTVRNYRYVRFTPVRLREKLPGQPDANSIQLAEFEFLNGGVLVIPVGVINPGGNSPAANPPANLIDGDQTNKWLDFNKSNVVFDFGVPTMIDGYRLTTGNDAPERDPMAWTLEGSDDLNSWTLIDAIVNSSVNPTDDFNYFLPENRLVASDEIPLPATVSIGAANIANFVASPVIVADGSNTDLTWVTAFSTSLSIDNSVGSVSGDSGTISVSPPLDSDTIYTLTVDNFLNEPDTATAFVRSVTQDSASYQYVRFTPLRLAESLPQYGVANSVQLSEFTFYNNGVALDLAALGTEVTNPSGNFPPAEGPANLIDGNTASKWLDFNKSGVVFDFKSAQTFNGYQWTTANDAANRDPVAWRLDGSSDGENWTVIDFVDRDRSDLNKELAFFYGLPRQSATQIIPLPDAGSLQPFPPNIHFFSIDAPNLVSGEPLLLSWDSEFGTTVTVDDGTGPVLVAGTGTLVVNPTVETTYTFAVSNSVDSEQAQVTVSIVTPSIDEICYENFDLSGEELELSGTASIVNDFANVPNPGDFARLRLTPISGSAGGTAWFRSRVGTSIGFDTIFDLHFPSGGNGGADGIAFILQNHREGTGLAPHTEQGLPSDALNIIFDSYANEGEASPAMVRVVANESLLAEVNLLDVPSLGIEDLTQANESSPYNVQVGYTSSGLLSVYLNQTPVIANLSVDLEALGAVDSNGTGYVGFSARTGGLFEAHDVTSWGYTEGEPVFSGPIELVDFNFDLSVGSEMVSLTWTSNAESTYRIVAADSDLSDFSEVLAAGITSDGATTSRTVSFTPSGTKKFVRVEQE